MVDWRVNGAAVLAVPSVVSGSWKWKTTFILNGLTEEIIGFLAVLGLYVSRIAWKRGSCFCCSTPKTCQLPKKQSLKKLRHRKHAETQQDKEPCKNNTKHSLFRINNDKKGMATGQPHKKHKRTGQSAIETSTSKGRKGTQHLSKRHCNRQLFTETQAEVA